MHTQPVKDEFAIPLENSPDKIQFFFLFGEDDKLMSPDHARHLASRLEKAGKHRYKLRLYPGVGHQVQPPYCPHIPYGSNAISKTKRACLGGDKYGYARGHVNIWNDTVNFVIQNSLTSNL